MTPKLSLILTKLEGRRRWLTTEIGLKIEATQHNIDVLRAGLPGLEVNTAANTDFPASGLPLGASRPSSTYRPKTAPYDHQKRAIDKIRKKSHFFLIMEQGTGKTKVAIDIAAERWLDGLVTGVIIVAPKGVHRQWVESQLSTHCGVDYGMAYWPLKKGELPRQILDRSKLCWFSLNVDAVRTEKGVLACNEFIAFHKGKVMVVMDESHMIKNKESQRWKFVNAIGQRADFRLAMTGTPIAINLYDEWSQLCWVDESIIGIHYKKTFINEYCLMGGHENKEIVGTKNLDRFKEKVEPFSFRSTKQDIGILPKAYDQWKFDLSPVQKQMIKEMKSDLRAQIAGGIVTTAAHAALKVQRIQQISNGFISDEDGKTHHIFADQSNNPRLIALKEFLDSKDGKAVIWCRYINDIQIVSSMLGDDCVQYYGAVKPADREIAVQRFLSVGGPRYFVSNPATGGTGLNLQGGCQVAVYYSNSENSIQRWQSEDRIHRIGTVGIVTYTDLVAKGSADAKILSNLSKKKEFSEMALSDITAWLESDWETDQAESPNFDSAWESAMVNS